MSENTAKILIVEDEEEVAGHMRRLLERNGYVAFTAHSMAEGLEKFEQEKPDVCVVDVFLTMTLSESGIDFLRAAYKTGRKFKSLVISGRCDEMLKEDIMALPINLFLEKPIEPAQLVDAVNKVVAAE
jgi:DNA-binding response OmpR family regulator